jgi:hypothetical protein
MTSDRQLESRHPQAAQPSHVELLLGFCALNGGSTDEAAQRLRVQVRESNDWESLIQLSLRHRVMPLFFQSLNTLCPQAAPPDVLERLRELFYLNAARNQFLTEKLRSVLRLLEADGIHAIAYKGPALAQQAYGDIALRQFNDLDVMVRLEDMPRISRILRTEGYEPQWQLTPAQEAAYLRADCERLFAFREETVFLDVHWAVVRNYFSLRLNQDDFRRRAQTLSLGETTVSSFAPEDLLIILCVHGSKDLWARLIWICDIAAIIRSNKELDWKRVLQEAESGGALRMLLLGLSLAQGLLNATLPDEVRRMIDGDNTIESLVREIRARLFQTSSHAVGSLTEVLFHLKVHERLSDKMRYVLRYATTTNPADWDFISLPDKLFFLYRLVRPLRLLTKPR